MTDTLARLAAALSRSYTIDREIGEGGMATVYLAHDIKHDRKVALKVLRPELAAIIGAERFLTEIKTTANLQHPHILALFDSGTVDGTVFYVMPYVQGESLRDRISREKQLPIDDALRIAREVAEALEYAHQHGVIHRDIKPENILLHGGHALVADFGIALAASNTGGKRMTETGMSLGTPHYMSPEQAMGERDLDARTDIYALGCVTYEMLTGEPPFSGPTAQAIVAKVMTEKPASIISRRDRVPAHVEDAVLTALEKLPADRMATAAQFSAALSGSATGFGPRSSGSRVAARRPFPLWQVGIALLGGLAIGAFTWSRFGASSSTDAAEPRFWSIALPDSAPLVAGRSFYDEAVRSLDVSADGKEVIYGTRDQAGSRLMLVRTDNGTITALPSTSGARLPLLAPDGLSAIFAVDTQFRRLTFADGSVTRVIGDILPTSLTWGADDRLYGGHYNGCAFAVPASGGEVTPLSTACTRVHQLAPVVGRPGTLIGINRLTFGLALVDAKTGGTLPITTATAHDTVAPDGLVRGAQPLVVAGKYLVFVRDSTMYAAAIDLGKGKLLGTPRPILSNVRLEAWTAAAHFALSASGTLVWAAGGDGAVSRFVWVSPQGKVLDTLPLPPAVVESYALTADGHRLAYSVNDPERGSILLVADLVRHVTDAAPFTNAPKPLNWIRDGNDLTVAMDGRNGIVHLSGASFVIDSVGPSIMDESRDGSVRCSNHGIIWRTPSAADSVRLDRRLNWCRFSPDGKTVSWDDSDGGYIASVDGKDGSGRQKYASGVVNEARWSRDGKTLTYRAANKWFAVRVPAPGETPETPRLLFEGQYNQARASWDLGPDGRFLLLMGVPSVRATHLNVITNFPRYVAEKLKGAK